MPQPYGALAKPARYKGAYGGRGSGKSHAFATLLLIRCLRRVTRAICVREYQRTLEQSVFRLLVDKIRAFGLEALFQVMRDHIVTPGGGRIGFEGMASYNAESIKSLEGYDLAWVEEAQVFSQRSLDLLRPTIRVKGSELWFSWNPRNETDPVDKFLRGSPPADSVIVEAQWKDNPWFPDVLRAEMEWDRAHDPEKYAHVWLGKYEQMTEARVFKNWRVANTAAEFDAIENPPKDAVFYFGADWGFAQDPTVLVRCWLDGRKLYIDHEAHQVGCEIEATPALFDGIEDGMAREWVITADSARPETISYMKRHGYPRMRSANKGPGSVEEGVKFLQNYDIIVHPRCIHTIDELTLYRYKTDPLTGTVLPKLEDKAANHCIAAGVLVTCEDGPKPIERVTSEDRVLTRGGYRRVLFAGQTGERRKVIRVETTSGTVVCTPDHEIWTAHGFARADALRYGDEVVGVSPWLSAWSGTVAFIDAIRTVAVDRIAAISSGPSRVVPGPYTETFGSIITDPFQQAITCITSMETRSIMPLRTLSASHQENIAESIPSRSSNSRANGSYSIGFVRWLRHGIERQPDERSTERSVGLPIGTSGQTQNDADSATPSFFRESSALSIGTARTSVSRPSVARAAWITKLGTASLAVWDSLSTAMQILARAHGHVLTVKPGGTAERVYDLTIDEHHEFFANGVLVSNCIDSIRYATEQARKARPSPGGVDIGYQGKRSRVAAAMHERAGVAVMVQDEDDDDSENAVVVDSGGTLSEHSRRGQRSMPDGW